MKDLKFNATINAPKQKVWDTMLQRETYKEWTGAVWAGSDYLGSWTKDTELRFVGPDGSGMLARVIELIPLQKVTLEHVGILSKGGEIDHESEMAKIPENSIEQYIFEDKGDATELTINLSIHETWVEMFEKDWPVALAKLKEISEH